MGGTRRGGENPVVEMVRARRRRSAKLERLVKKMSLEPVENTTTVNSGRILGVGHDNYVPFITVLLDDDYPDGMPDGEKYPEGIPENTTNRNIFQQRPAHGVPSGNNKRKRESEIMLDYERVSTTKRKQIDYQ